MSKKTKFITTIISFIFILNLLALNTFAAPLLFYDDFSDGDTNGWEEHLGLGGSWTVANGEYLGSVSYNSWGSSTYALAGETSWTNYSLDIKVRGISGVDKKIKFRHKNNEEYYELNLRSGYNDLAVQKISPYGWLIFKSVENFNEVDYHIKVDLNGSNIKIYINDQLKFDYTDKIQPILNGKIGLEAWPGAAAPQTTVAFDDIEVTALDPTPDNFLPVPYFSQRDPFWGTDEYDHASNWIDLGEENTIDWWGCALTSGAMVAKYFGIDKTPYGDMLNPGTLNKWMKDQNDAYFRNGAMNWQLLSRMSAKTADLYSTNKLDLSLSKLANNFTKLDEILTTSIDGFPGSPGILEVTHPVSPSGKHFLVTKGRSGTTFGINDPYDDPTNPTRNLLSINPYNNSFDKMIWYEPTHSNLSTIFLVVNQNINIAMLDPTYHPTGDKFDLPPLGAHDALGGESGETLKMLYLEEPVGGYYSVGLTTENQGSQGYWLDIYLYDKNAQVKIVTLVGILEGPRDQDNISFYFDWNNVQNSRVNRQITFTTLRDNINSSYFYGWIDNEGVATGLLAKVDAGEKAWQKENKKTEENILNALLAEIEAQKEKHINLPAFNLIKEDLEFLLSQP